MRVSYCDVNIYVDDVFRWLRVAVVQIVDAGVVDKSLGFPFDMHS